jgi:hypothetical protein
MRHSFTALAVLLAVAPAATAQALHDTRTQAPLRAHVTEVVIERLPAAQPSGLAWDAFSAADPWVFVSDSRGAELAQFGPYEDLPASSYPVRLPVDLFFSEGEPVGIVVYDDDTVFPEKIIEFMIGLGTPSTPGLPIAQPFIGPDGRRLGEIRYVWLL